MEAIEKEIGLEFTIINPDEENFNERKTMNEIYRQNKKLIKKSTKKSTKKSVIDNISKRLCKLEFEENLSIKSNFSKGIVKYVLQSL